MGVLCSDADSPLPLMVLLVDLAVERLGVQEAVGAVEAHTVHQVRKAESQENCYWWREWIGQAQQPQALKLRK